MLAGVYIGEIIKSGDITRGYSSDEMDKLREKLILILEKAKDGKSINE